MPPKKAKKKVNLSPEERRLIAGRKRAMKKLAAEEAKKQQRRDHLSRELAYGEMNWKILQTKLRDLALKIRMPQLKQQVEAAWHFFEHTIDCKNLIITRLLNELDQCEKDHQVVQQKHIDATDEIMQMFKSQLEDLHEDFQRKKTEVLQENQELLDGISSELHGEEEGLKVNLLLMKERTEEYTKNLSAQRFFSENEEKNEAAVALVNMREKIEKDMEEIWARIKAILEMYITSTDEPKKEYDALNAKDKNARKTLEFRLQKTKRFHDSIIKLKDKLILMQDLSEVTLTKLQDERQYFVDTLSTLCRRMKEEKYLDHSQLVTLTSVSNETAKWLENVIEKGEHILKLGTTCREMETEEEKVIPFPYYFHVSEEEEETAGDDETGISGKVWQNVQDFEHFWQKVSQVELKYTKMLQLWESMLAETNELRNQLKWYVSDMATV